MNPDAPSIRESGGRPGPPSGDAGRRRLTRKLPLLGAVLAGAALILFAGYGVGLRLSPYFSVKVRPEAGAAHRDGAAAKPVPEAAAQETPRGEAAGVPPAAQRLDAQPSPILGDGMAAKISALGIAPETLSIRLAPGSGSRPGGMDWFLDSELQEYVMKLLERSNMVQAGVVVLRPSDGAVLAMASYGDGGENVCLKADYPAASLFKIISAAAALEASGLEPDSLVSYHGGKHTLYRGQLKEKENARASRISLSEAFADSINPVFGKLGIYRLGRDLLSRYAEKFCFNRAIPFDARVAPSFVEVPAEDFGLAEVASGFNKETLISPLHAALLAAVAANDGVMMAPRLIDRVMGDSGDVLYASRPEPLATPISRATARELRMLMADTVESGTCRKSLKPLLQKKRLRDVELGAKTGTINDREGKYKYDWVVAYAIPPRAEEAICISVMGVHGKRLGIRAGKLGGLIIGRYLGA